MWLGQPFQGQYRARLIACQGQRYMLPLLPSGLLALLLGRQLDWKTYHSVYLAPKARNDMNMFTNDLAKLLMHQRESVFPNLQS